MEGIKLNQASQVTRPRTKPDQSEGSAGQLEAVAEAWGKLSRTEGVLCHEHGERAESGSLAPSSHAQGEEKGWGKKKSNNKKNYKPQKKFQSST